MSHKSEAFHTCTTILHTPCITTVDAVLGTEVLIAAWARISAQKRWNTTKKRTVAWEKAFLFIFFSASFLYLVNHIDLTGRCPPFPADCSAPQHRIPHCPHCKLPHQSSLGVGLQQVPHGSPTTHIVIHIDCT